MVDSDVSGIYSVVVLESSSRLLLRFLKGKVWGGNCRHDLYPREGLRLVGPFAAAKEEAACSDEHE